LSEIDGTVTQVVAENTPNFQVEMIEVKDISTAINFVINEGAQRMTLDQLPLFRVILAAAPDDQSVVGFIVHHLIFDGTSASVFMYELDLLMREQGSFSYIFSVSIADIIRSFFPQTYRQSRLNFRKWSRKSAMFQSSNARFNSGRIY
jgi:hypothetical protein